MNEKQNKTNKQKQTKHIAHKRLIKWMINRTFSKRLLWHWGRVQLGDIFANRQWIGTNSTCQYSHKFAVWSFCGRCSPKIPEPIDRATFRTNRGEVAWGDCAKKTFIFLLSPSSSCTSLSSGTFLTLSIVKYLCVKFPVSFLRITLNIYHLLSSWSFPKIYSLHLYGTHWVVKSFYMDKNFQIV